VLAERAVRLRVSLVVCGVTIRWLAPGRLSIAPAVNGTTWLRCWRAA
jgi:hypothetical protein